LSVDKLLVGTAVAFDFRVAKVDARQRERNPDSLKSRSLDRGTAK
jgi:hypothetical protein